jgi:hypothetical protein
MSCRLATVEQAGASEKHCASADRADSPSSSSDFSEPSDYFNAYLVTFDCIPTGNEQSVDLPAQLTKRLMRCDSQATVRKK